MTKKDEKDFIEPEILNDDTPKKNKGEDFFSEKINDNFSGGKEQFLIKGILVLLPYILGTLLFFFLVFGLIFLVFDEPFDYILSAILLYFLTKGVLRIFKFF